MRKGISNQLSNIVPQEEEGVRQSEYKINSLILNRWSPRAMSEGDEGLSNEDLMPLFEAARWAPSSSNVQPWRFIYAKRNTVRAEGWNRLFDLLVDFNKSWAKNAAVLIVIVSKKELEYKGRVIPSVIHQFDTGAAWENLALEASSRGLVAHAMAGFDYEKARRDLDIPDEYDVMVCFVLCRCCCRTLAHYHLLPLLLLDDNARHAPREGVLLRSFLSGSPILTNSC